MANRKASGEDKMPADFFKKAPEIFQKRAIIIVKLTLTGRYRCKPADLDARVTLLCKDSGTLQQLQTDHPLQHLLPTGQHYHNQ